MIDLVFRGRFFKLKRGGGERNGRNTGLGGKVG